jgi:hypothetical protein
MFRWFRCLFTPPTPAFRRCERCERPQVIHVTTVNRDGKLSFSDLCEPCARAVLPEPDPTHRKQAVRPAEVRVEVERVVISEVHDHQAITFREVEGEQRFWLVIGIYEATVIDRVLRGLPSPRPLTHDAWQATVAALGARVRAVCIHRREEATYFAELRLDRGGELVRVDARPSDAVALGLRARAPILIAVQLLAEVFERESRSA